MLQHTFCHLPGISVTTERQLWAAGIDSWDAALAVDRGRLPRRHQRALRIRKIKGLLALS